MPDNILNIIPGAGGGGSQRTLWTIDQTTSPYYVYVISVSYKTNFGRLQLPVSPASGVIPSQIVTTHLPYGMKIVKWDAVRLGKPPALPNPYTSDPNVVLADVQVTPSTPYLTPGGLTRIFPVSGVYIYYLKNPILPGTSMPFGNAPFDASTITDNSIQPSAFTVPLDATQSSIQTQGFGTFIGTTLPPGQGK